MNDTAVNDASTGVGSGGAPLLAHIAMLGGGSMGSAIAGGALAAGGASVSMTTRSSASAAGVVPHERLTVRSLEVDAGANRWAVRRADVVVVAVKPAGVLAVLEEVAAALPPHAIVVSVAAGISIGAMERVLPDGVAVLRAMPNTPSAIGKGVTGLAPGSRAGSTAIDAARAVFATVGTVIEVPENRIDALSAVSGSGPAYVYYFVEQLLAAAERLGFQPDDARAMVLGTVDGAVRLLMQSGEEPADLRRRVTSPKGTTERAIAVFAKHDLGGIVDEAFAAAIARATELSAG